MWVGMGQGWHTGTSQGDKGMDAFMARRGETSSEGIMVARMSHFQRRGSQGPDNVRGIRSLQWGKWRECEGEETERSPEE